MIKMRFSTIIFLLPTCSVASNSLRGPLEGVSVEGNLIATTTTSRSNAAAAAAAIIAAVNDPGDEEGSVVELDDGSLLEVWTGSRELQASIKKCKGQCKKRQDRCAKRYDSSFLLLFAISQYSRSFTRLFAPQSHLFCFVDVVH